MWSSRFSTRWKVSRIICCWTSSACKKARANTHGRTACRTHMPCSPPTAPRDWHHRSSRRGSHGGPGLGAGLRQAGLPNPTTITPASRGLPRAPAEPHRCPRPPHQVLVEADEPRLAVVVEHQDGVDHPGGWTGRDGSRTGAAAVAASPQEAPRPPRKRGGGAALRTGSRQAEPGRPREDPAASEQPGPCLGPTRSAGARGPGDARSRSSRGARAGTQPLSHCQGRGLPGAGLLDRGLPRPSPGQRQPPGQTGEGATVPRGPRRGRARAGLEPGRRRRRPHREDAAQARRRPRRQGAHQPQSDGSRGVPRRGGASGRRGPSPGRSWRQTTPSLKAPAPLPAGVVVGGVRGHRRGLAAGVQCGRPEQTPAWPGRGCCPPGTQRGRPCGSPRLSLRLSPSSRCPTSPCPVPSRSCREGRSPPTQAHCLGTARPGHQGLYRRSRSRPPFSALTAARRLPQAQASPAGRGAQGGLLMAWGATRGRGCSCGLSSPPAPVKLPLQRRRSAGPSHQSGSGGRALFMGPPALGCGRSTAQGSSVQVISRSGGGGDTQRAYDPPGPLPLHGHHPQTNNC